MKKVLKVELIKHRHIFKNVNIDGYIYYRQDVYLDN